MIMLTRLNGLPFALNPDLIERAEATPDTVLTLCDGTKLVIGGTVEHLVETVRQYRAGIISLAGHVPTVVMAPTVLHVVPQTGGEG